MLAMRNKLHVIERNRVLDLRNKLHAIKRNKAE